MSGRSFSSSRIHTLGQEDYSQLEAAGLQAPESEAQVITRNMNAVARAKQAARPGKLIRRSNSDPALFTSLGDIQQFVPPEHRRVKGNKEALARARRSSFSGSCSNVDHTPKPSRCNAQAIQRARAGLKDSTLKLQTVPPMRQQPTPPSELTTTPPKDSRTYNAQAVVRARSGNLPEDSPLLLQTITPVVLQPTGPGEPVQDGSKVMARSPSSDERQRRSSCDMAQLVRRAVPSPERAQIQSNGELEQVAAQAALGSIAVRKAAEAFEMATNASNRSDANKALPPKATLRRTISMDRVRPTGVKVDPTLGLAPVHKATDVTLRRTVSMERVRRPSGKVEPTLRSVNVHKATDIFEKAANTPDRSDTDPAPSARVALNRTASFERGRRPSGKIEPTDSRRGPREEAEGTMVRSPSQEGRVQLKEPRTSPQSTCGEPDRGASDQPDLAG